MQSNGKANITLHYDCLSLDMEGEIVVKHPSQVLSVWHDHGKYTFFGQIVR